MKAPKDTYDSTCWSIARTILNSSLIRDVSEHTVEELQRAIESDTHHGHFNVDFNRCDNRVSCTLYAKLASVYGAQGERTDEHGNIWAKHSVSFDVTWPSHGSTSLAQAQARVDLYREVVALATQLAATFDTDVWSLSMTKVEVDQMRVTHANAMNEAKVRTQVELHCTNMRVGNDRAIQGEHGIAEGTYEVTVGAKKYAVSIRGTHAFCFTRTA